MKKSTLVLFSLFALFSVSAQEVVATQGDSYANASGGIDFTIGEVVINTGTDGAKDLTQGFHQTNWNFVGVEDHTPSYEATVYPNPTSDLLNIKTSTFENVTYTLYDAQGKLIMQDILTGEQNTIDIEAGCATPGTAADICANLALAGYTDWFLPSKDELNLMYENIGQGNVLGLGNVGGFAATYNWSSTEDASEDAWYQHFGNGIIGYGDKANVAYFRSVRAF
jgi:hypothetical protein